MYVCMYVCMYVDYFYELHLSSLDDIHMSSDLSKQQTAKRPPVIRSTKLLLKTSVPSFRAISNSSYHYLFLQKKNMI